MLQYFGLALLLSTTGFASAFNNAGFTREKMEKVSSTQGRNAPLVIYWSNNKSYFACEMKGGELFLWQIDQMERVGPIRTQNGKKISTVELDDTVNSITIRYIDESESYDGMANALAMKNIENRSRFSIKFIKQSTDNQYIVVLFSNDIAELFSAKDGSKLDSYLMSTSIENIKKINFSENIDQLEVVPESGITRHFGIVPPDILHAISDVFSPCYHKRMSDDKKLLVILMGAKLVLWDLTVSPYKKIEHDFTIPEYKNIKLLKFKDDKTVVVELLNGNEISWKICRN